MHDRTIKAPADLVSLLVALDSIHHELQAFREILISMPGDIRECDVEQATFEERIKGIVAQQVQAASHSLVGIRNSLVLWVEAVNIARHLRNFSDEDLAKIAALGLAFRGQQHTQEGGE